MALDLHTAALVVGALAVLAALLAGALLRSGAVRAVVAVAGLALLAWGALPFFPHAPPVTPLGSLTAAPAPAAPRTTVEPGTPGRLAAAAIEDCHLPDPPQVPDAAKASRSEMVAAHSAFQAYDSATKTYTGCVDAAVDKITVQFAQAGADELNTVKVLGLGAHNTAIDQEQALADQFNVQVRAFKAKHPGE